MFGSVNYPMQPRYNAIPIVDANSISPNAGRLADQYLNGPHWGSQTQSQFQHLQWGYQQAIQNDSRDNGVIDGSIMFNIPQFKNMPLNRMQDNAAVHVEIARRDLMDDNQLNGSIFQKAYFQAQMQREQQTAQVARMGGSPIPQYGFNPMMLHKTEFESILSGADMADNGRMDGFINRNSLSRFNDVISTRINFLQQNAQQLPNDVYSMNMPAYTRLRQGIDFVQDHFSKMSGFDGNNQNISLEDWAQVNQLDPGAYITPNSFRYLPPEAAYGNNRVVLN